MKVTRHALLAGLLYAVLGVALPFQIVLTSDTPTIRFKDDAPLTKHLSDPVHENKPSIKQYIEQMREEAQTPAVTATPDIESGASRIKPGHTQPESESDNERDRAFRDHYGAVLGKLGKFISDKAMDSQTTKNTQVQHNHDHHIPTPTPTSRTVTYLKPVDFLDIINKHGPECVALAIFVLIPIAYFLLELLELAIRCCVQERYPQRGRDRVRLLGPERQLRAWSNRQRDQFLEGEKHWWQVRKTRY